MFRFLTSNNLIENHIQKGFFPKTSGTLEHTALLSHIIRDAKRKQRSLVITLLGLQNTFGNVQHGLIDSMLKYHQIPDHVIDLVDALYADFKTTITTRSFATSFKMEKGVLEGDYLSPLLFNSCINSFIRTQDRRILFLSNQRICYGAARPIRSLEMTMEYAGLSVILQK